MAKYTTKPITVEAWKWDESKSTLKKISCNVTSSEGHIDYPDWIHHIRIQTIDGSMAVRKGDYIIKKRGMFYPCSPGFFKSNYQKAEPDTTDSLGISNKK